MAWYVAIVGINQESLALRGLSAKGYKCYCPAGRKTVRHARKQEIRTFFIFSRYLFINFEISDDNLAAIRDTDGVIDFITNLWIPVEIPAFIIEDIKQRELAGEFDLKEPKFTKQKWAKSFEELKRLLNPGALITV
jgi:transcription antitermination factor NusG